jgi:chloramphenicol 3-O phosphotransferase
MEYRVIVLNGVSSSGKSSIARALQAQFPDAWLTMRIDDLIAAMPEWIMTRVAGIAFEPDGRVRVGAEFARLEQAWMRGVAAMARAGAGVIVDDVWLSGAASQARWRAALGDVATLWVGVHCDPAVLAERERARGDRIIGMAAE